MTDVAETFGSALALPERILVTGAGGFVGRRVVERLLIASRGAAAIFSTYKVGDQPRSREEDLPVDFETGQGVAEAVATARPDLVIHLAAQASVGRAVNGRADTWRVNLGGSLALADAIARTAPHAKVLLTSSSEVYGAAFNRGTVSEDTLPEPLSEYARSKLAAEQVFAGLLPDSAGLMIARPANHSGAGQSVDFVLPSFAAQIVSGRSEILVGNLAAERDFTHVDDVVDAYMEMIGILMAGEPRTCLNISSGATASVGDLLDRMIALWGKRVEVVVDPARFRPADIPVAAIDSSRLRRATGWLPKRRRDRVLLDVLEHAAEAAAAG